MPWGLASVENPLKNVIGKVIDDWKVVYAEARGQMFAANFEHITTGERKEISVSFNTWKKEGIRPLLARAPILAPKKGDVMWIYNWPVECDQEAPDQEFVKWCFGKLVAVERSDVSEGHQAFKCLKCGHVKVIKLETDDDLGTIYVLSARGRAFVVRASSPIAAKMFLGLKQDEACETRPLLSALEQDAALEPPTARAELAVMQGAVRKLRETSNERGRT